MNNLIEKITPTNEPSKLYQDLVVNLPIKLGLMLLAVALITLILLIVMLGFDILTALKYRDSFLS